MRSRFRKIFPVKIVVAAQAFTSGMFLHGAVALARTAEPAPDIDAWIAEARQTSLPIQSIPQRILLLETKIEDPVAVNFLADATGLEKISPFIFIDAASSTLTAKLNHDSSAKGTKGRKINLSESTSANVVIAQLSGNSPLLYVNDGEKLRKLGNVKPYKGDKSPDSVLNWLYQVLGYDGVLLARKGTYVLVSGSAAVLGKDGIQALAIRGSESQLALLDKKRSGSSLLEIEVARGPYAVLRILALAKDSGELPVGVKLTIQRERIKKESE